MHQMMIEGVESNFTPKPPKHQPNRRKSVQDKKTELRQTLAELCNKPPQWIGSAGIEATRNWMGQSAQFRKLLKNDRASVPQLEAAVNAMSSAKKAPPSIGIPREDVA